MSGGDDWAPGDLALCVDDVPLPGMPKELAKGALYTVDAVFVRPVGVGLTLIEAPTFDTPEYYASFAAKRFRKIHPLTEPETAAFTADLRDCLRTPAKHTA
jgi:hypothetical protein